MNPKIQQAIIGGIMGTAVMTMVMFMAPMMGMPKMNAAEMLSGMMGVPVTIGWLMHFMIGIIFALAYVGLLIKPLQKVKSKFAKGAIFGMAVFIFAQIVMAMMNMMGNMPAPPEGTMAMMMVGSIMGHLVYGIVTILFIKEEKAN